MTETIKSVIILEIMGRPKEHLTEVMKKILEKLSKEVDVTITKQSTKEPKEIIRKDKEGKPLKNQKELFSVFSEVEIETKDLLGLMNIIFTYMPSHIEILAPSELRLKNFEVNSFINELARRMHEYDNIAKGAIIQNKMLLEQIEKLKKEKN